jgi:LysR family transcriptional regulator, glycine cleavage system transcriptional activator
MVHRRLPPLIAARGFEVAARRLSFQDAAEELNVTPTAVSHQVRRLEEFLGVQLFQRGNRTVALTEAGAELARNLHEIFTRLDQVLAHPAEQSRTTLRISAMRSFAAKWLAPRLGAFEARHPKMTFRIEAIDRLVNFSNEEIDVGLRYGDGNYPGQYVELLMPVEIFPVCSPQLMTRTKHPLKEPADLRHHTLIHIETPVKDRGLPDWPHWLKAARIKNVDASRGPVFDSSHMALEAAIAGHGVALAIAPLVQQDLESGRLVQPFSLTLPSPFSFWIVCKRDMANTAKIRALRKWLHEEVG